MKYISELREILSHQLDWHRSRLDCFVQILLDLFIVNLSEIALAMDGSTASIDSGYNREFLNKKLISWLVKEKILFYLRIKSNVVFFALA